MKKKSIIIFGLLLLYTITFAQRQIEGIVSDLDAIPLPGATVLIKGTNNGTVTDLKGKYVLTDVSNEAVIVISYVGMLSEEILVGDQTKIDIQLIPDLMQLEDIVVIGYGSVKRKDLTGAVSSVKSEEIVLAPVTNSLEAIQGRVAGLDITRNDGRSSSGISILLRGDRSIKGEGDEPLYIIDGIPGSISNLNPCDIISMDILKDASSTAIYGASGANGVIMITTKTAEKDQFQVDFNSYISINGRPSFPRPLQDQAWFDYLEEGYIARYDESPEDRDQLLSSWGLNTNMINPYIDSSKWIDWVDESLETGIQNNTNLSIRAGNEKVKSSFSIGYNKTEGIYKNDFMDFLTLRENLSIKASDRIKFGIITGLAYKNRESRSSRINKSFGQIPLGEAYDNNGKINPYPIEGMTDYVSVLADNIDGTYSNNKKSLNITANPYIEIEPLKGLNFKSIVGTSLSADRQGIFNSDHTFMKLSGSSPEIKNASYITGFSYSYTWENILSYKKIILQVHNVGATLITSYGNSQKESSNSYSEDFLYDEFLFFNLDAGVNPRVENNYEMYKRMSYAGRLNYDFKGKYLVTGSLRYDGVSQLAKTWDIFPSGAIAWRISEEDFMNWSTNWLSNLKLRTGYGIVGSNNIEAYSTKTQVTNGRNNINLGSGQLQTTVPTQSISNDQLGWEKTYSLNIGLDFGLISGRVVGSFDWYSQETKHLIYDRDLPFSNGGFGPKIAYTIADNIAEIHNKGVELTLNTVNIQSNNFQWNSTLTFSRNINEVVSIELASGQTSDNLITEGLFIGSPRYVHYGYKKTGIWQTDEAEDASVFGLLPGDVKVETDLIKESDGVWYLNTTNENGNDTTLYYSTDSPYTINADDDRQILGQAKPKWIAGFHNTFTYKGFDLNIFITARWGHMIEGDLLGYFDYGELNMLDIYNYWTPTNATNDFPRPYTSRSEAMYSDPLGGNSLNFADASYIKVKNITFGYTLPQQILENNFISTLRIYGTVYNSLIYTRSQLLRGIDPESGVSDSFPLYKQLVFGINVSF